MLSNNKNIYKNYREELLNVLWFLNVMSAIGGTIARTTFPFPYGGSFS